MCKTVRSGPHPSFFGFKSFFVGLVRYMKELRSSNILIFAGVSFFSSLYFQNSFPSICLSECPSVHSLNILSSISSCRQNTGVNWHWLSAVWWKIEARLWRCGNVKYFQKLSWNQQHHLWDNLYLILNSKFYEYRWKFIRKLWSALWAFFLLGRGG